MSSVSPVSCHELLGGRSGVFCHILAEVTPVGLQISLVITTRFDAIPANPEITGAVLTVYVGGIVVVVVVVVLEVVVGLNGAALVVVLVVEVEVEVLEIGNGNNVVVLVDDVEVEVEVITITANSKDCTTCDVIVPKRRFTVILPNPVQRKLVVPIYLVPPGVVGVELVYNGPWLSGDTEPSPEIVT